MPKGSLNMSLKGADDIFSTEESRQEQQREQVQQIPIGELHPFTNHPFKVVDDEAMTRTVESIAQFGVLAPLIARPRPDGDGYEIISGHRRQFAAKMAGLETLPVIVRNMDDDAATILMVDSNLQREHISPSERAFAYKMKMDAMKRTAGRPSKENSRQVVGNFETADLIGKESGESGRQVQRFIRLTNLIPELLNMVDEKKVSFNPAVELSYLSTEQQQEMINAMDDTQNAPSFSQAKRIKKLAQEGNFTSEAVVDIMGEEKKSELDTVTIKNEILRKYFPRSYTPKQMEEKIIQLLDAFWEKSERLLLTALIAYLHYEAPVEEQNFATLLEMLNTMQVLEDDEEYQNPVDLLFEELAKKKPNSFAGRQYKLYKLAAGKTAKSILISCGARLAPFDIQELRDLTMYDELQLDTLGDKKTALFLIMSDTDSTFNFLISMVYTQLFNLLCDKADDVYGGKLPIHVRCLIDECANIGQIPQLEKLVATIRSREISACLVLQAKSQLKAIYKDNADTIIGNMDSQIFLGGSEPGTLKDLSEMLGKETIDSFNTSDTRGNSPSYGTSFQKLGHELLSRDELAVLDGGKCILQLRGVRPFLSDKYDLTQHPNYKLTSDYDPKNTFDIEKYLNRKEKINPNDEFVVIDADSLPPA